MSPATPTPELKMAQLTDLPLADVEQELATTRRVLERIPDEHFGWKPHEKSMTLGELARHLVNVTSLQVAVLVEDGIDFASAPPPSVVAESRSALLDEFDASAAALRNALQSVDDAALERDWTLRSGSQVIFTRPRLVVLRSFGLSHLAHHRGQLTVYLRMLDVPLPPVYGPTADER